MGFLSPWFLAGLLALGLPLWLHLLRQFKRTPQPFSSLMFFERRVQSSTRHRRLRYLALLAARLALLTLLALAFANPFVYRSSAVAGKRSMAVIAIDRSFSMRYDNHLAAAKARANQLIDQIPSRVPGEVLALAGHVEHLTQPTTDRAALHAAVEGIQPSDQAGSFGELSRALRVMDQSSGMRIEASFISDMQQTSMPSSFTDLQVGPHTAMRLLPVESGDEKNWAVENVSAPSRIYSAANLRITAVIAGWQTPPLKRKAILAIDSKTVAEKEVNVPDCGTAQVEFTGLDIPYGAHRAEVRIEPHDSLPQDDFFHFALERADPRKILFLYRQGRAKDAVYYRSAMDSAGAVGLAVQTEPVEQAGGETLSQYAFVVLSDPGGLDERLTRDLNEYVRKGGAVFVSLGPRTLQSGQLPLLSARLEHTSGTEGAGYVDNGDPVLAGTGQFENVAFTDSPSIPDLPNARIVARLADGRPLLVQVRTGEGQILFFASTLDNSATDFPLHASYLPFVVQTASYLSGAEVTPSSIVVDAPVNLRQSTGQTTAADVIGPDGRHELSLSESTHALIFNLPVEGFYEIQRADGRRRLVAANADRRESDLTPAPNDTLEVWRNTGGETASGNNYSSDNGKKPWSLWRWILGLVLVAALVESIFANRYLREERQAV